MRLLTITVFTLTLSACTLWPEKKNPGWDDATGIEHFERNLWKDIRDKNFKETETRLASNFRFTTKTSELDKSQALAAWQAAPVEDFTLGEINVVPHGDTATITYSVDYRAAGAPKRVRRMDVWQQQSDRWVLIAAAELE